MSPIFCLVSVTGEHFFCDTDRCGSNFFMYDEDEGWLCNSCKEKPTIAKFAKFHSVNALEVETTNTVPVTLEMP